MRSPNKIIQKRTRRKERYARSARKRYRRETNVYIAKPLDLATIRSVEEDTKVYHFCLDLVFGEKDGKLDYDISMLNKSYISNAISVVKEGERILTIVLQKIQSNLTVQTEVLQEWESRGDLYWTEWAEKMKLHLDRQQQFIKDNVEGRITDKVAAEWVEKKNKYMELRRRKMTNMPCLEKTVRIYTNNNHQSEISFNSNLISTLGYEFNEFRDKVLREGIPRIRTKECAEQCLEQNLRKFESIFVESIEYTQKTIMLKTKDHKMRKATSNVIIVGYFIKNGAEVNILVSYDDIDANSMPFIEEAVKLEDSVHVSSNERERKEFLQKYYTSNEVDS